ncbi:MAG: S9 family peptidase, partial [Treponema sp.]|nr:S9 family peptidase [Treponema sp.]
SESPATNAGEIFFGMYEAVKMLDSLEYVDSSRIGITGHSLGGMSSNVAIGQDNAAPRRLIRAVLLNCADAAYINADTKEYADVYGSRYAGILAAQYDEFFFRQSDGKGGTTPPGNLSIIPTPSPSSDTARTPDPRQSGKREPCIKKPQAA